MRYYLAGLTAFSLWGFSSLAVKPLSAYASGDILFYRVLFAFGLMVLLSILFRTGVARANFMRYQNMDRRARRKALLLTLAGGVFLTSNWFFFIFLINHVSVKAASFSYLVCPIVTMVLASVFLREKLGWWQWVAVGMSTFGCWLLSLGHWEDVFYSLIVAFSYAAYLVSQRANAGFDSLVVLTLHVSVALFLLLITGAFYSYSLPDDFYFYQYLIVLVLLLTILPLSLNLYALRGVTSSGMGMLLYINPVLNFLLAVLYFKEEVSNLQLISYGIIVASIVLFNKGLFFGALKKDGILNGKFNLR